jgi:hypothetical protein
MANEGYSAISRISSTTPRNIIYTQPQRVWRSVSGDGTERSGHEGPQYCDSPLFSVFQIQNKLGKY